MKPSSPSSCISRILRRILCFSSLSSRPFDHHLKEEEREKSLLGSASGTPGIVARLMGLESIPRIEPIEGSPSMSISSDSLKMSKSPQVRSRRIIPTYQELEDDNFFILSFEHGGKNSGKNSGKCKKKNMRRRENLQKSDKENEGVNMVSKENLDLPKEYLDLKVENPSKVLRPLKNSSHKSEKRRKKKGSGDGFAVIKFETEGESENSSPNSVLEFVEFPADQESASSGDISRLANSKMRRTLSEELENCRNSKEKRMINNNGFGGEEKLNGIYYAESWDEMGKLSAMEMMKSTWVHNEISKDEDNVKEIARDLASRILDQLLDELLVNIPLKTNFNLAIT